MYSAASAIAKAGFGNAWIKAGYNVDGVKWSSTVGQYVVLVDGISSTLYYKIDEDNTFQIKDNNGITKAEVTFAGRLSSESTRYAMTWDLGIVLKDSLAW